MKKILFGIALILFGIVLIMMASETLGFFMAFGGLILSGIESFLPDVRKPSKSEVSKNQDKKQP